MAYLGLSSGRIMEISEVQYQSFMKRREGFAGGLMFEIQDEEKKPLGKVKLDCIEFVAAEGSPILVDHSSSESGTVHKCPVEGCGKVFSHSSSLSRHKAKDHD